jgi:hypothetical protein
LDIQEYEDSAEGWYRQLCGELAGEGVASVDEAVELLRLRPLHRHFEGLLVIETSSPETVFAKAYDVFTHYAVRYGLEPFPDEAKQRSLTLWRLLGSEGIFEEGLEPVLIAWLVIGPLPQAVELWSALRLATVFEREAAAKAPLLEEAPGQFGALTSLLLRYAGVLSEQDVLEITDFTPLFHDSDVLEYLQVHEVEGVRWFNREAFRLFVGTLLAALQLAWLSSTRDPAPLLDLQRELSEAELKSGYELEALLEQLTGVDSAEAGESDSIEQ